MGRLVEPTCPLIFYMIIKPSPLREWNNKFEFNVKYNISDCSAYSLSADELFELSDSQAIKNFKKISLGYTKSKGDERLRQVIANQYQNLSINNILVTAGAIEAIYLTMNSLFNSGDEIIVGWPCYPALYEVAAANGVAIKYWNLCRTAGKYCFDIKQLAELISKKTKAIVINQPQVPTGFVFEPKAYSQMIDFARKNNLYIIADEVCRWLSLENIKAPAPIVDVFEKGISIGDLSKPFGAGGLRIGWVAARDSSILDKLLPLRGYTTMSNSAVSELLAAAVLLNKEKILFPRLEAARENWRILNRLVGDYSDNLSVIKPVGGVTALVKYNYEISSVDFCSELIKKENVMLVPGSVYGWEKCFRIGLGTRSDMFKSGIEGLRRYLRGV